MDEPEHKKPIPLEYGVPDASDRRKVIGHRIAGTLIAFFVVVATFFASMLTTGIGALPISLAILVALIFVAERFRHQPDFRGITAGIYIGIGLALLCEGACFMSIRSL